MKLISTTKAFLQNDREGSYEEHVLIDVQVTRDTENDKYDFVARDYVVENLGEENESMKVLHDRNGAPVYKPYSRTYQEFDEQTKILSEMYPNDGKMNDSEYQDYLMGQGFLFQLAQDPIYGVEFKIR